MPDLRFFFDAGSGGVLWPQAHPDQQVLGYPACLDSLDITDALRAELTRLVEQYDTSLDWNDPAGPCPWSDVECHEFNVAVHCVLDRLRTELGPHWQITDQFTELPDD